MGLRVLILLAGLCFFPVKSFAVTCTVGSVPNVAFNVVDPFSTTDLNAAMTFSYSCQKELLDVLSAATICFNLYSSAGTTVATRRMTATAGNTLNYQLYQDSARTNVWGNQNLPGSTYPVIQLKLLNLTPVPGTLTVYAKIPKGQNTTAPGNYIDTYTATTATITLNIDPLLPSTSCGTTVIASFGFSVTATVNKQCTVNAANNINLGSSVAPTETNITGSNTFTMTCTNTTTYTIGLSPSNSSTTGSGMMKSTKNAATNTDQVPYQLYSTAGINGIQWGNGATNLVSGAGIGSSTTRTVYAIAPGANYKPDEYADTVTINVTY